MTTEDQAAAEAAAAAAVVYLNETRDRPLNAQQRELRRKAERLARWLARDIGKEGRR